MISNFGVADGGRETWAYNFIPRLLERWPSVMLDIIGLHRIGQPDNSERLRELLGDRGSVTFFESNRKRFPVLSMLRQAPRAALAAPDLVIGVGSAIEALVILLSPTLRRAKRISWLRTILTHERATQLPGWLGRAVRTMEMRLLHSADGLIANGEDTAAWYRARGLEVSVVPNAVDVERWRAHPPALVRPLKVAFIGRLAAVKGAPEFLALADQVHGPDFEFHVIGEGPYALGIEGHHVIYHGGKPNDELPALTAKMDVCVALTFKSSSGGGGGLSNALLEQMASGRVILAWDNEIFRQILDETNAYLAPQDDVNALGRALGEIVDHPKEARRRALSAQRKAEGYSFDAHMRKFGTVLRASLGAHAEGLENLE